MLYWCLLNFWLVQMLHLLLKGFKSAFLKKLISFSLCILNLFIDICFCCG